MNLDDSFIMCCCVGIKNRPYLTGIVGDQCDRIGNLKKNGTARIVSVTGAPSVEEVKANVEAKPYKCEPNFDLANQMKGVKIAFDI